MMAPVDELDIDTVRTLAVVQQGLQVRPARASKGRLLSTIRQIGLLQLDSISVVSRSHYLVALSRLGLFDPNLLGRLQFPEARLCEQWAHAASLMPAEDVRFMAPLILRRRHLPLRYGRLEGLGSNPKQVLRRTLNRVRREGPIDSASFQDSSGRIRQWWNRKPARVALDVLFHQGYLGVAFRKDFKCYFDLAERILPRRLESAATTVNESIEWAVLKSLRALGTGTEAQIADYYRLARVEVRLATSRLLSSGSIIPVAVKGWNDPSFMLPEMSRIVGQIRTGKLEPRVTTFLSPFDNLIWDRDRTEKLFGFQYRIQMYNPATTRKDGYYVMPILRNGRIIGRVDPRIDRGTRTLVFASIRLEPGIVPSARVISDISRATQEFMRFHQCQRIQINHCRPHALGLSLSRVVGS